ncbi:hypothetical protein HanXRQr2_Chr01g0010091 [Helianthus annuus]|uniref:Uncharacterized protein n=1 Tax=Helianthus annuus TaxID=4232 RepID=A0A9K3P2M4_HELAN|nr:hypothetical protein HanXRQr2_Chr01g0010091 [Helianthus annuus]KAJ0621663.1 hypothetical protein HanIR_Chr01g0011271 [Helianthus annuus]KAJ0956033.1 hypothetical protein HanPSC8_Chr01g0009901 [Helianthus annuus]
MDFLSNTAYIPVITATSLVVLVLYVYNRQQGGRKAKKHHPITRTMFNQLLNFHRLHDYMTDLAIKHNLQINYSFPQRSGDVEAPVGGGSGVAAVVGYDGAGAGVDLRLILLQRWG